MSPLTCLRTLLMLGLVLIPTLQAAPLEIDDLDQLQTDELRELLENLSENKKHTLSYDELSFTIELINDRYGRYVKANDIGGIVSMYDPNVLLVSNGVTQTGVENVRSSLEKWVEYVDHVVITTEVLVPLDPENSFVFERKVYAMYSATSKKPLSIGRALLVWRQTDKGYKTYIQINVSK